MPVARRYKGRTYTRPAKPIGAGRPGTARRKIYRTGGGKTTLRTFRSFGDTRRRRVVRRSRTTQGGLSAVVRGVRRKRLSQGKNPTTGKRVKGGRPRPTPNPVVPKPSIGTALSQRSTPLRVRRF